MQQGIIPPNSLWIKFSNCPTLLSWSPFQAAISGFPTKGCATLHERVNTWRPQIGRPNTICSFIFTVENFRVDASFHSPLARIEQFRVCRSLAFISTINVLFIWSGAAQSLGKCVALNSLHDASEFLIPKLLSGPVRIGSRLLRSANRSVGGAGNRQAESVSKAFSKSPGLILISSSKMILNSAYNMYY